MSTVLDINTFVVSGTVTSLDGEPVRDVTVFLHAFAADDWSMSGEPVSRDTTYTSQTGQYKITKFHPYPTTFYKVIAMDCSVLRADKYYPSEKQIFLNYGTSYNPSTKSYELHGLNFFLYR